MPELPEVETVLRTLEQQICGKRIEHVQVLYERIVEEDARSFELRLLHQHFRSFARRGKYLLFYMDDCILCVHLRMEGKFFLQKPKEPRNKHIHVCFTLSDGLELRYQDTRKFGRMCILPLSLDLEHFHNLGPEPFSDAFNEEYVYRELKNKHSLIKTVLLDQSFVAGIGNIYADEILFACGIRPQRRTNRITRKESTALVKETRRILLEAIAAGGTTIRTYTSSLGVTGRFQLSCKVHAQKNCGGCGKELTIRRIGGRSSYYCPQCQK